MNARPTRMACANPHRTPRRRPPVTRRLEPLTPFPLDSQPLQAAVGRPEIPRPERSKEATTRLTRAPVGKPAGSHVSYTSDARVERTNPMQSSRAAPRRRDIQHSGVARPRPPTPEGEDRRDLAMRPSDPPSQHLPKETPLGRIVEPRVRRSGLPSRCLPKETPLRHSVQPRATFGPAFTAPPEGDAARTHRPATAVLRTHMKTTSTLVRPDPGGAITQARRPH
jgi:hypothetical protein